MKRLSRGESLLSTNTSLNILASCQEKEEEEKSSQVREASSHSRRRRVRAVGASNSPRRALSCPLSVAQYQTRQPCIC